MPRSPANVGVERGRWGESLAAEFLRREGLVIVERNSRPCVWNRTLEIDVIAYDRQVDTMVFVEVKQHSRRSLRQRRLRSIDGRKLFNLRRACRAWMRANSYFGGVRFDVVEIYGEPGGGRPEIDHVKNVNLFARPDRFTNWGAKTCGLDGMEAGNGQGGRCARRGA